MLANACGPCIGQWKRDDIKTGERNSIITSFNRNFPARNDGNAETLAFIGSPEIVIAFALAGRLDFNPLTDTLDRRRRQAGSARRRRRRPSCRRTASPRGDAGYVAPPADGSGVAGEGRRARQRAPAAAGAVRRRGTARTSSGCRCCSRRKGKCTTDHISPAGPWLRYRGHLDNISDNMFIGAINAFTGEAGKGRDLAHRRDRRAVPADRARTTRPTGMRWVVVGDENYGEGSSREHAAMSPRFLGGAAVIVRSFARIHETNLKKQGMLPLTFAEPGRLRQGPGDRPRQHRRPDGPRARQAGDGRSSTTRTGTDETIQCRHSFNAEQIAWFKAGSALNLLREE